MQHTFWIIQIEFKPLKPEKKIKMDNMEFWGKIK